MVFSFTGLSETYDEEAEDGWNHSYSRPRYDHRCCLELPARRDAVEFLAIVPMRQERHIPTLALRNPLQTP